jgi:hypothetical protein
MTYVKSLRGTQTHKSDDIVNAWPLINPKLEFVFPSGVGLILIMLPGSKLDLYQQVFSVMQNKIHLVK